MWLRNPFLDWPSHVACLHIPLLGTHAPHGTAVSPQNSAVGPVLGPLPGFFSWPALMPSSSIPQEQLQIPSSSSKAAPGSPEALGTLTPRVLRASPPPNQKTRHAIVKQKFPPFYLEEESISHPAVLFSAWHTVGT